MTHIWYLCLHLHKLWLTQKISPTQCNMLLRPWGIPTCRGRQHLLKPGHSSSELHFSNEKSVCLNSNVKTAKSNLILFFAQTRSNPNLAMSKFMLTFPRSKHHWQLVKEEEQLKLQFILLSAVCRRQNSPAVSVGSGRTAAGWRRRTGTTAAPGSWHWWPPGIGAERQTWGIPVSSRFFQKVAA